MSSLDPRDPREHALDELKIGGDPQKAVAYALLHLADQFGEQPTHEVRTPIREEVVTWVAGRVPPGVRSHQAVNYAKDECHCGSGFRGSDHCPACGCEIYERYCNFVWRA